jgi:hypothetical protein
MLAALCLAMVFAIALSSYVALCYVSLSTSTRNVVNEHALELAEAGVEQALYSSNNNAQSGWNVSTPGATTIVSTLMTMTSSGLQPTSGGPTPLNYGNGSTGTVNIAYTYTAGQPSAIQSITSTAQMTLPTGTVTAGTGPTISRTLTYNGSGTSGTAAAPVFVNAVAATSNRVLFSVSGTLDSYNSNPSPGVYQDYSAAVAGCSAVVASQLINSATATVRLNNAVVYGYAVGYSYSSPASDNWLSYSSSGELRGKNLPPSTTIDSSRILSSPVPYQPVFPVATPFTANNIPAACCSAPATFVLNQTSTIGNPLATTPTLYNVAAISLSGNAILTVTGPVVLIVGGSVSISGALNAGIQLTTSHASLAIIANNGTVRIGANGISNTNSIATTGIPPLPKRVALLSSTNSTNSVTISTTTPFYGVVYFPNLVIGVTANAVICGSIVGASISISGSPTIHYDNALRSPDSAPNDAAFAYISAPVTVNSLLASVP